MSPIYRLVCAIVALFTSCLEPACAQLDPTVTQTVQRVRAVDTGWVSTSIVPVYAADGVLPEVLPVTIGTFALERPARFVGTFSLRYTCLVENTYGAPVAEYQVYSRNEIRIGAQGSQLCSQLCGALAGQDALAPSDGQFYAIPDPLPEHNVGVGDPLSDHHLMPVNVTVPLVVDLPPGATPITVGTAAGMGTWNDAPVVNDSHAWRLAWPRYQARVAGWIVR